MGRDHLRTVKVQRRINKAKNENEARRGFFICEPAGLGFQTRYSFQSLAILFLHSLVSPGFLPVLSLVRTLICLLTWVSFKSMLC